MGTDWSQAKCIGNPEIWTDDLTSWKERARAKSICRSCPVQVACLEIAIKTYPSAGIWGGFTYKEIANLRRNGFNTGQKIIEREPATIIGRPRKNG